MANYRWSICEPASANIIEMGSIEEENILQAFEDFPWLEHLQTMQNMKEHDIQYSPSLEFENTDTGRSITFWFTGQDISSSEFYFFYKRPVILHYFFGLMKRKENAYLSTIRRQTREGAILFLEAFLRDDIKYMETKMKQNDKR